MLLGPKVTGPVLTDWRFVEKDLHDIASRVREYDRDARLVREDETGHLGLVRWHPRPFLIAGGHWTTPRAMFDLDTDKPLMGEPDGRVLRFQRASDSWGRNLRDWYRRTQHAEWMQEKREQDEQYELNLDHAEHFVHALKKDVSARPRAFVPRDIPKAA